MKAGRVFLLLVLLAVAAGGAWLLLRPHPAPVAGEHLTVYYTKIDGSELGAWDVSLRPQQTGESNAEHLHDAVVYAAVQSVAGPPGDVAAVRFPAGTHVRSASVDGTTATVDLSREVGSGNGGSFQETGEFKGLVYTLTGIATINAVQITIEGRTVETLPGGHLELDAPLRRSDW